MRVQDAKPATAGAADGSPAGRNAPKKRVAGAGGGRVKVKKARVLPAAARAWSGEVARAKDCSDLWSYGNTGTGLCIVVYFMCSTGCQFRYQGEGEEVSLPADEGDTTT